MESFVLEACVDSVESALAASEGGATRLELCGNLIIGGTTPAPALFEKIQEKTDIRVHVLIRPRFGDFCYTDDEFDLMCREVRCFRQMGAGGVVFGILKPDGSLDGERMKSLLEEAGGMSVTLHRAFDVCADPFQTMEEAKALGIDTILTSGQKNCCREGQKLLRSLVDREEGRITIMAGGGVDGETIRRMYPHTGVRAFHMSGKKIVDGPMVFRRPEVSMGLPGFDEYERIMTDKEKLRQARLILEGLPG